MLKSRVETVRELCSRGVLHVEDGNHGEYRPLRDEFVDNGTPFVRPPDLVAGRVQLQSCDKINETARNRVRKGIGRGGDILFTHRATVGRMALMPEDTPEFVANPGVTVWRVLDQATLDRRFLYFWMQSQEFLEQVWAVAGSTDTFPYVSLNQQRELKVRVPNMIDQEAIGSLLGALDDKIELNRRMNETLEAMARAIFKDWFVDFGPTRAKADGREPYLAPDPWDLFPDALDDEDKPVGWRHWMLADLAVHHRGTVSPAADPERLFEHYSIPAYEVRQEPTLDAGASIKSNKTVVPADAVLLSKLNPDIPRVWIPDPPNYRPQVASTEFLAFTPKPPATRHLLYCLFRDAEFRREMEAMVTGTSKSHQRISPKALTQSQVLYGSAKIFEMFDRQVSPLLARVLKNRAESRTLAATRDLLLPRLMAGEIRLRGAEKVVEAVA